MTEKIFIASDEVAFGIYQHLYLVDDLDGDLSTTNDQFIIRGGAQNPNNYLNQGYIILEDDASQNLSADRLGSETTVERNYTEVNLNGSSAEDVWNLLRGFVVNSGVFYTDDPVVMYNTQYGYNGTGVNSNSIVHSALNYAGISIFDNLPKEGGTGSRLNIDEFIGISTLLGSNISDTLYMYKQVENIDGRTGNDTADFSNYGVGIGLDINLSTNEFEDQVFHEGGIILNIENVIGTVYSDIITGNALDNTIEGGDGVDTISGGDGHDTFIGDQSAGGSITGDSYNGGLGNDTVDYSNLDSAIYDRVLVIDLAAGTANNQSFVSDTLVSIENATGTADRDIIFGTTGSNVIDGFGGNDELYGLGSADTFKWGENYGSLNIVDLSSDDVIQLVDITTNDLRAVYVDYNGPNPSYTADFYIWIDSGAGFDTDKSIFYNSAVSIGGDPNFNYMGISSSNLIKFRNPDGSLVSLLDIVIGDHTTISGSVISGDSGNDTLQGTSNSDLINGGAGNDTLQGDAGNDTLNGDSGNDTLHAGAGDDIVHGGSGNDTISYFYSENTINIDAYFAEQGTDTLVLNFNSGDLTSGIRQEIISFYNFIQNPTNINTNLSTGADFTFTNFDLEVSRFETLSLIVDSVVTQVTVDAKDDDFAGALNTNITGNLFSDNGYGADSSFAGTLNATAGTFTTIQGGSIVISSNGAFTYTPGTGFTGADAFAYTVDDGNGLMGSAIAHFMVGMASTIGGTSGADTLNGTNANEHLSGGAGNDTLNGNDGNDVLNGGAGDDTMNGGNGNDTFIVNSASDSVNESSSAGTDEVHSSITYTLTNNVENLIITGAGALNGTGNSLNNTISGGAGDNILDGGSGNDTLKGGLGNDTYIVDSVSDVIVENSSEGTDTVSHRTPNDYTMAANIENMTMDRPDNMNGVGNSLDNIITGTAYTNVIYGMDGNDTLRGFAGGDTLYGGNGNDTLDGGIDNDWLIGGAGDDTFVVDHASDNLTENSGEGTDTVQTALAWTLATHFENLTLTGTSNVNATGNSANNVLVGNSGNNTLDGGAGNDTMTGGAGNDIYVVDSASDSVTENADEGTDVVQTALGFTLGNHVENLTITGASAVNGTGNGLDNVITGNSANNMLTGNAGNDTLDGGTGNDTLVGGTGNDTFIVDNNSDIVTESSGEGFDTVRARTASYYTLGDHVENLILDRADSMNGTGNALNNVITGTNYVNILDGLDGNDALYGLDGNDTLYGGAGNDIIDGGGNADSMYGGAGDDIFYIDSSSDNVFENSSEGTDQVISSVNHTLGSNFENLTLSGSTSVSGTGNSLNNIIIGNSGNNTLDGNSGNDYIDGGTGVDSMYGGTGDDIFIVDNTSDGVSENSASGTDEVRSSASYTLSSNVENLVLTGTSGINATGNTLNNTITGNSGNNTIDGGSGNDTMIGGLGNDTYIVDSLSDVLTENASEGTDTVQTAMTFTLSYANVENLILTGSSNINGTGNALDNVIIGNNGGNTLTGGDGNDTLNGGADNDTMIGGTGNDSYVVNLVGDVITENSGEGTDTVSHQTANDYTLSANVENMTMDRADNMNGTGNALANTISGTAYQNNIYGLDGDDILSGLAGNDNLFGGNGNDFLNGGEGIDSMLGGAGDDTVVIDHASDDPTEYASEGTDTVLSSITYTLETHYENLTLIGSSNINATGNSVANIITGNNGANTLSGGDGNDTLIGKVGADALTGGNNADTFLFDDTTFGGTDTISDFNTGQSDKLDIADLLVGYNPGTSDINDFATLNVAGGNTTLLVDRDGAGSAYSDASVVTLNGVTGLNLADMLTNGHLIAS